MFEQVKSAEVSFLFSYIKKNETSAVLFGGLHVSVQCIVRRRNTREDPFRCVVVMSMCVCSCRVDVFFILHGAGDDAGSILTIFQKGPLKNSDNQQPKRYYPHA